MLATLVALAKDSPSDGEVAVSPCPPMRCLNRARASPKPTGSPWVRLRVCDAICGKASAIRDMTVEAPYSPPGKKSRKAGDEPSAASWSTRALAAFKASCSICTQSIHPPSPSQKRPLHTVRIDQGSQQSQTKATRCRREVATSELQVCTTTWRKKTKVGTVAGIWGW